MSYYIKFYKYKPKKLSFYIKFTFFLLFLSILIFNPTIVFAEEKNNELDPEIIRSEEVSKLNELCNEKNNCTPEQFKQITITKNTLNNPKCSDDELCIEPNSLEINKTLNQIELSKSLAKPLASESTTNEINMPASYKEISENEILLINDSSLSVTNIPYSEFVDFTPNNLKPLIKNGSNVSLSQAKTEYEYYGYWLNYSTPYCVQPLWVASSGNIYTSAISSVRVGSSFTHWGGDYSYQQCFRVYAKNWNAGAYSYPKSSCGSNLIQQNAILTAAHCLGESPNSSTQRRTLSVTKNWDFILSGNKWVQASPSQVSKGSLTYCPKAGFLDWVWPSWSNMFIEYCHIVMTPSYTTVRFGSNDRYKDGVLRKFNWGQDSITRKDNKGMNSTLYEHYDYNYSSLKNDIALIKLNTPLPTSLTPIPVLTDNDQIYEGQDAYIIGHGAIDINSNNTKYLQYTEVSILNSNTDTNCIGWSSSYYDKNTNLCAGFSGNISYTSGCSGDSGGPLVVETSYGKRLAGLTSFGPNTGGSATCATSNKPLVYVRLPGYIVVDSNKNVGGWLVDQKLSIKSCNGEIANITNTTKTSATLATNFDDVIYVGSNNKSTVINGNGGNDVICDYSGPKKIFGGAGSDFIFSNGDDIADGSDGIDTCQNALSYVSCEEGTTSVDYGGLFDSYTTIAASYTPKAPRVLENYSGTADETEFKFTFSGRVTKTCDTSRKIPTNNTYFGDYKNLNFLEGIKKNSITDWFESSEYLCGFKTKINTSKLLHNGNIISGTLLGKAVDATCTGYFRKLSTNTCSGTIGGTDFEIVWNPTSQTFSGSGSGAGILVGMYVHQLGIWYPTTTFTTEPEQTYGGLFDSYTTIAASYTPKAPRVLENYSGTADETEFKFTMVGAKANACKGPVPSDLTYFGDYKYLALQEGTKNVKFPTRTEWLKTGQWGCNTPFKTTDIMTRDGTTLSGTLLGKAVDATCTGYFRKLSTNTCSGTIGGTDFEIVWNPTSQTFSGSGSGAGILVGMYVHQLGIWYPTTTFTTEPEQTYGGLFDSYTTIAASYTPKAPRVLENYSGTADETEFKFTMVGAKANACKGPVPSDLTYFGDYKYLALQEGTKNVKFPTRTEWLKTGQWGCNTPFKTTDIMTRDGTTLSGTLLGKAVDATCTGYFRKLSTNTCSGTIGGTDFEIVWNPTSQTFSGSGSGAGILVGMYVHQLGIWYPTTTFTTEPEQTYGGLFDSYTTIAASYTPKAPRVLENYSGTADETEFKFTMVGAKANACKGPVPSDLTYFGDYKYLALQEGTKNVKFPTRTEWLKTGQWGCNTPFKTTDIMTRDGTTLSGTLLGKAVDATCTGYFRKLSTNTCSGTIGGTDFEIVWNPTSQTFSGSGSGAGILVGMYVHQLGIWYPTTTFTTEPEQTYGGLFDSYTTIAASYTPKAPRVLENYSGTADETEFKFTMVGAKANACKGPVPSDLTYFGDYKYLALQEGTKNVKFPTRTEWLKTGQWGCNTPFKTTDIMTRDGTTLSGTLLGKAVDATCTGYFRKLSTNTCSGTIGGTDFEIVWNPTSQTFSGSGSGAGILVGMYVHQLGIWYPTTTFTTEPEQTYGGLFDSYTTIAASYTPKAPRVLENYSGTADETEFKFTMVGAKANACKGPVPSDLTYFGDYKYLALQEGTKNVKFPTRTEWLKTGQWGCNTPFKTTDIMTRDGTTLSGTLLGKAVDATCTGYFRKLSTNTCSGTIGGTDFEIVWNPTSQTFSGSGSGAGILVGMYVHQLGIWYPTTTFTTEPEQTYGGLFDSYTTIAASYTPKAPRVLENYSGTADETEFKFTMVGAKANACKGPVPSDLTYFGDYKYLALQEGTKNVKFPTRTEWLKTGQWGCNTPFKTTDIMTRDGTTLSGTLLGKAVDATCTGYFRKLSTNTCSGTIGGTDFEIVWNPTSQTFSGSGSGAGILVGMYVHQLGIWYPTTTFTTEPEQTYGGLFDSYTTIAASYTPKAPRVLENYSGTADETEFKFTMVGAKANACKGPVPSDLTYFGDYKYLALQEGTKNVKFPTRTEWLKTGQWGCNTPFKTTDIMTRDGTTLSGTLLGKAVDATCTGYFRKLSTNTCSGTIGGTDFEIVWNPTSQTFSGSGSGAGILVGMYVHQLGIWYPTTTFTTEPEQTYGGLFDSYTTIAASYTPKAPRVLENYSGTADETEFKFTMVGAKANACKGPVPSDLTYFGDYKYLALQEGTKNVKFPTRTEWLKTGQWGCNTPFKTTDIMTRDGTTLSGTLLGKAVDATCTGYFRKLSTNTCSGTIGGTDFEIVWNPTSQTFSGSGSGAGILVGMYVHQLGIWYPTTTFTTEPVVKITSSESLGSCVEGKATSTLTVTSDVASTVTGYVQYYYAIGNTISEVTVTTVEPDASIELTAEVLDTEQITWYYRTSISNSFSGDYTSVVSETVDCPYTKITSSESLGSCVEGKATSTLTVTSDVASTVTGYVQYYYAIGNTISEVTVTTVEPDASIELIAEVSHNNQITWYYRASTSNSFSGSYTSVVSETVDCPYADITATEAFGSCPVGVSGYNTSTLTVTSDVASTVTGYVQYYYAIGNTISEVTVTTVEPDASIELIAEVSHNNQITWSYRASTSNSFSGSYTSVVSETVDCPERTEFLPSISDINITSNENFSPYDFNIDRNRIDISFNYISGTETSANIVFRFKGKNTGTLLDTSETSIENISTSGTKTSSFRITGNFVPDEYYIYWIKYENIANGPSDCPSSLEIYSSGSISTSAIGCVVNDDFLDGTHDLLSSDDSFIFIEDDEAPTWSSDSALTISDFSSTAVTLTWSTCTDNVEVVYFQLYVNDIYKGSIWDGNVTGSGAWENSWDGEGTATITPNTYGLTSFEIGDEFRIECRDSSNNDSTTGPSKIAEVPKLTSFEISSDRAAVGEDSIFNFTYTIDPGVYSEIENETFFHAIRIAREGGYNFSCAYENITNEAWQSETFSGSGTCLISESSYLLEGREVYIDQVTTQWRLSSNDNYQRDGYKLDGSIAYSNEYSYNPTPSSHTLWTPYEAIATYAFHTFGPTFNSLEIDVDPLSNYLEDEIITLTYELNPGSFQLSDNYLVLGLKLEGATSDAQGCTRISETTPSTTTFSGTAKFQCNSLEQNRNIDRSIYYLRIYTETDLTIARANRWTYNPNGNYLCNYSSSACSYSFPQTNGSTNHSFFTSDPINSVKSDNDAPEFTIFPHISSSSSTTVELTWQCSDDSGLTIENKIGIQRYEDGYSPTRLEDINLGYFESGETVVHTISDLDRGYNYNFWIICTDEVTRYHQNDGQVSLTLENLNKPQFNNNESSTNINENGTSVGNYGATDADGDTLSYSVDNNSLTIDSDGNLSFIEAPDYESGTTQYEVTISVTDGTSVTSRSLTINILNLVESPVINESAIDIDDAPSSGVTFDVSEVCTFDSYYNNEGYLSITYLAHGDHQSFVHNTIRINDIFSSETGSIKIQSNYDWYRGIGFKYGVTCKDVGNSTHSVVTIHPGRFYFMHYEPFDINTTITWAQAQGSPTLIPRNYLILENFVRVTFSDD